MELTAVATAGRPHADGAGDLYDPADDADDLYDPADDVGDDVELARRGHRVVEGPAPPPTPSEFYVEDLAQAPADPAAVAVDVGALTGDPDSDVDTQGYVDPATGQYVPYEDAFFDGEYEEESGGAGGVGAPLAGRLVDWRGDPVDTNDDVAAYYLQHAPAVAPACPPRPPPKPPAPPPQALAAVANSTQRGGAVEAKGMPPSGQDAQQAQTQMLQAQMQAQLVPQLAPPANWYQLTPQQQSEWQAQAAYVQQYNANVQRYYAFQQLAMEQQLAYQAHMQLRQRELAAAQAAASQTRPRHGGGLAAFGGSVLSKVATIGHSGAGKMMSGVKGQLNKLPGARGVLGAKHTKSA